MKLAFLASETPKAQASLKQLQARYGQHAPAQADVLVPLGGDGWMLEMLHKWMHLNKPFYGMKRGSLGFLLNRYHEDDLPARISQAEATPLSTLRMQVETVDGDQATAQAFNEVSLLRETGQAAHIRISINDTVKVEELICDGVLVATSAGSTAYNYSAHGPILPLGSDVLALTPISPFRPRRWRGAILPGQARIHFEVLDPVKRPVSATADATEIRNVRHVHVEEDHQHQPLVLFDPEHNLEERILNEQFVFD